MSSQNYTYAEHRFRFAAWAAARAAMRGFSFKNEDACPALKEIGLDKISGNDYWLLEIDDYDIQHAIWRNKLCNHWENKKNTSMSHGRAAKFINVFIKTLMPQNMNTICPNLQKRWCEIHPPIDSIILENMSKCNFGNSNIDWKSYTWTKLDSKQYQELIDNIRKDEPCLWKIERFWTL